MDLVAAGILGAIAGLVVGGILPKKLSAYGGCLGTFVFYALVGAGLALASAGDGAKTFWLFCVPFVSAGGFMKHWFH